MRTTLFESDVHPKTTLRERTVDMLRHATHFAGQAGPLKVRMKNAMEDGVRSANRSIRRGVHNIEDARDSAAYRIKRAPVKSMALTAGGGVVVGAMVATAATLFVKSHGARSRSK